MAISLSGILLSGMLATGASDPAVVLEDDKASWWVWANPPAVNIAAEGAVSRDPKLPPLKRQFEFLITSAGRVAECRVSQISEDVYDDATLCALIALHQYRPSIKNSARTPIRTFQTMLIGVDPDEARKLVHSADSH